MTGKELIIENSHPNSFFVSRFPVEILSWGSQLCAKAQTSMNDDTNENFSWDLMNEIRLRNRFEFDKRTDF